MVICISRWKVEQLSQFSDTKELAHKIVLDAAGTIPPRFEPDVEKNLKELQKKRSEQGITNESRLCFSLRSFILCLRTRSCNNYAEFSYKDKRSKREKRTSQNVFA